MSPFLPSGFLTPTAKLQAAAKPSVDLMENSQYSRSLSYTYGRPRNKNIPDPLPDWIAEPKYVPLGH